MENQNIHLNVTNDGKPAVIRMLEGKAEDPINLKPVTISGRYDAVTQWWKQREKNIDKERSHVEVDIDLGTITLFQEPYHPHCVTVKGQVTMAKHLAKLKIETTTRFTSKELSQLLRTNRVLFSDPSSHSDLLKKLNSFAAKAQTELDQMDDSRGNAKDRIETKLETDIPQAFTLKTAVIQGGEEKQFEVNICMEVRDKGISFWLESTEMSEILLSETKNLLVSEACQLNDIAIIYK